MSPFGPRIMIKRDEESSVGRGCVLYAAHFRPIIAIIPRAAAAAAPLRTEEVWLTEGYRNIRSTRDRHEDLCAFDITYRLPGDTRATEAEYKTAAERMRWFLSPDYDLLVHGEGTNRHIHCEWDPDD